MIEGEPGGSGLSHTDGYRFVKTATPHSGLGRRPRDVARDTGQPNHPSLAHGISGRGWARVRPPVRESFGLGAFGRVPRGGGQEGRSEQGFAPRSHHFPRLCHVCSTPITALRHRVLAWTRMVWQDPPTEPATEPPGGPNAPTCRVASRVPWQCRARLVLCGRMGSYGSAYEPVVPQGDSMSP